MSCYVKAKLRSIHTALMIIFCPILFYTYGMLARLGRGEGFDLKNNDVKN